MIRTIKVFPTSRAIRQEIEVAKKHNSFLPTYMRIDEFEQRAIRTKDNFALVDKLERVLILREIAMLDAFSHLHLNVDLVKFFTRSDAIFGFFDELALEKVSFEKLRAADAYAEFDEHIAILEKLKTHYKSALNKKGLTDRVFIVEDYELNVGFLKNFESIEIVVEGQWSRYEFELFDSIAKYVPLIISFTTSKFTSKMQERFSEYGVELATNAHNIIDFSAKKVLQSIQNSKILNTKVFSTKERFEQIGLAFIKVEEMVKNGILPEKIAIVVPDESISEAFDIYDRLNNLNFAMGFSYQKSRVYKGLASLFDILRGENEPTKLLQLGFTPPQIDRAEAIGVVNFFQILHDSGLVDFALTDEQNRESECVKCAERYFHFSQLFVDTKLTFIEWLALWIVEVGTVRIDDNRGGKVTVLGALETRGVMFDGVVVVDFNDGIVPSIPSKDHFLNSEVRLFASLPTINDREAHQKQIYKQVLENAKESVILYATNDDQFPALYIDELGLKRESSVDVAMEMLYQKKELNGSDLVEQIPFCAQKILWSPSKLKLFLNCKRRFYYEAILGVKQSDEEPNEGSVVHKILEELFAKASAFHSKVELEKALHASIARHIDGMGAYGEYKRLLMIEKLKPFVVYQMQHFQKGFRVVAKELSLSGEIDGLRFGGRCDRIDQNMADTLVIDYKTSSDIKSVLRDDNDFQMVIYRHLLQDKYPNATFVYWQPYDKQTEYLADVSKEKEARFNEILNELHVMSVLETAMCEDESRCRFCPFIILCKRGDFR